MKNGKSEGLVKALEFREVCFKVPIYRTKEEEVITQAIEVLVHLLSS